ncbi:hypothetical protein PMAYCL1PPCAC_11599 [Pristionchus mayeri]|uniref:Uncharacterized protein n=1 Tax=Pristionchus mayeri TaxID=1317129 RepID=A0AAN5CFN0_9BILA|nr:hypothetical protein PMAYCL1PPCAC_11599 [Pristionchus mayeri]
MQNAELMKPMLFIAAVNVILVVITLLLCVIGLSNELSPVPAWFRYQLESRNSTLITQFTEYNDELFFNVFAFTLTSVIILALNIVEYLVFNDSYKHLELGERSYSHHQSIQGLLEEGTLEIEFGPRSSFVACLYLCIDQFIRKEFSWGRLVKCEIIIIINIYR